MKKFTALFILSISLCSAYAENLFQYSNPFPQTEPQKMNNIYESEPAVIKQEGEQAKKSWFRKGKNLKTQDEVMKKSMPSLPVYPTESQNNSNDNFYVFTTDK